MAIIKKPGHIGDNIYLVDTMQFDSSGITSCFIYWDGDKGLILDCGTSDNVETVLDYCDQNNINKNRILGIMGSHYHFDHMGGAGKIWQHMTRHNPDFKIIVAEDMMTRLQHAASHVKGAQTTFGRYVGTMEPMPNKAYMLVEKDTVLNLDLDVEIKLLSTPGHTPDHCSATFYHGNEAFFAFTGEAAGCIFHGSQPVSSPTSMPPNFNYQLYMINLQKLKELKPAAIGFCHFGALKGKQEVSEYLNNHQQDMASFYELVVNACQEKDSIRHVIEQTSDFFNKCFDTQQSMPNNLLKKLHLALVYGLMVDLGLRKPKYEERL